MRWLIYFIFAYVCLGLQIGLSPYVRYQGAAPSFTLLAVIFIAMNAPRDAAWLGAFVIGLIQDLLSAQPPGLYALAYGMVAVFVHGAAQVAYRGHPLTHFSLALVAGLLTMFILLLHGWIRPPGPSSVEGGVKLPAIRVSPGILFTSA